MTKSQMEFATRKAKENFDRWNDTAGFVQPCTGAYDEIMSLIEDAVHIGSQVAIYGDVATEGCEIIKNR